MKSAFDVRSILKRFKTNNELQETGRRPLVNLIINFYIEKGARLNNPHTKQYPISLKIILKKIM